MVEVKCPYACRNQSLSDAVESLSLSFLEQCPDGFRLRNAHFYQVQFQLLVTGSQWADFVVWTPSEIFV